MTPTPAERLAEIEADARNRKGYLYARELITIARHFQERVERLEAALAGANREVQDDQGPSNQSNAARGAGEEAHSNRRGTASPAKPASGCQYAGNSGKCIEHGGWPMVTPEVPCTRSGEGMAKADDGSGQPRGYGSPLGSDSTVRPAAASASPPPERCGCPTTTHRPDCKNPPREPCEGVGIELGGYIQQSFHCPGCKGGGK